MTEPTPAEFLDRARRFERAAWLNIEVGHPDTLPAVLHLAAHALELTLKAVLLREGRSVAQLKGAPYGHDIAYMWNLQEIAFLREMVPVMAMSAVEDARRSPRWPNEHISDADPAELFFEQVLRLSELHSAETGFALRYPAPDTDRFPRPPFLVDVIGYLIDEAKSADLSARASSGDRDTERP